MPAPFALRPIITTVVSSVEAWKLPLNSTPISIVHIGYRVLSIYYMDN
jgi:hypothetical protein